MNASESVWPREWVSRDCFAIVALDITAPFFVDMGLHLDGLAHFVESLRSLIDRDSRIFGGAATERLDWFQSFQASLRGEPERDQALLDFRRWIAQTFTHIPADRPNWEAYEMFFFEWAVHMRDGEDTARCFRDPHSVYEAYQSFVRSRGIDLRIQERRKHRLSKWDERVFALGRYSLIEDAEEDGLFDPFSAVRATAYRYYFQLFWEFLQPRLSTKEIEDFWAAITKHYVDRPWREGLVRPEVLSRKVM